MPCPRCGCEDLEVGGCGCSWADSNCVNVTGDGSVANPLKLEPILDTDPNQLASCSVNGLLSKLPSAFKNPPYIKLHRSTPQTINATSSDFIAFDTVVFQEGFSWSAGDPTKAPIPLTGLYEVKFHVGMEPDTRAPNAFRADVVKGASTSVCYTVVWSSGPGFFADPSLGIGTRLRDSTFTELNAGDYLRLKVQNNTSDNIDSEPVGGLDNVLELIWKCPKST